MPIGFAGGLQDPFTGLVRFGYRDYFPEIGRFTAKDPLGDGGGDDDLYDYCTDDPVTKFDPLGLTARVWNEGEHPRDWHGKFIFKGNEGGGKPQTDANQEGPAAGKDLSAGHASPTVSDNEVTADVVKADEFNVYEVKAKETVKSENSPTQSNSASPFGEGTEQLVADSGNAVSDAAEDKRKSLFPHLSAEDAAYTEEALKFYNLFDRYKKMLEAKNTIEKNEKEQMRNCLLYTTP